jgi:hypothetical protein
MLLGPCHHGMAHSRAADRGCGPQMWRAAANILKKQSRTADKEWSFCWGDWGLGEGLTTPRRKNRALGLAGPCESGNKPSDSIRAVNFLTSWVTINFWRRTLPRGVSYISRNTWSHHLASVTTLISPAPPPLSLSLSQITFSLSVSWNIKSLSPRFLPSCLTFVAISVSSLGNHMRFNA